MTLHPEVVPAQQDTLRMTREECEGRFLAENLLLIAARLELPKAEALVEQARKWPNPRFTLDQVNLWASDRQTGGEEVVPPLFGRFGRNQQFGMELEQLILTARKRSRLVELEKVKAEKAGVYFAELLRNLKLDFRTALTHLQYLQSVDSLYRSQREGVSRLVSVYEQQVREGHIPRSELIRLRALELELAQTMTELRRENVETQQALKVLMRLPAESYLTITDPFPRNMPSALPTLPQVLETARQNRPDLDLALLEERIAQRLWEYEKARRTPDITIKGAYDRNGNAMLNFFGIGASLDLPLFDRNQGQIRHAELEARQAKNLVEQQTQSIENDAVRAFRNLEDALRFYRDMEQDYEGSLDQLRQAYTQNFLDRNVSLLEFLDFTEAYLKNKTIILEAQKSLNDRMEELNHAAGSDLF
mgnify:CR=1 FL=1